MPEIFSGTIDATYNEYQGDVTEAADDLLYGQSRDKEFKDVLFTALEEANEDFGLDTTIAENALNAKNAGDAKDMLMEAAMGGATSPEDGPVTDTEASVWCWFGMC